MYKAYVDNVPLFDPPNGYFLIDPTVTMELNKVGSFEFTIYPDHPAYDLIRRMASVITVYDKDQMIFKGRALNDTEGFHNELKIECESDLAYLLDSVQRPYSYQGTLDGLFEQFINAHNEQVEEAKRFKVGNITVTDSNDYIAYSDSTYLNTWDSINKKLIETHGGYLFVRHEADGNYLDYLADFSLLSSQPIEFGKNLLDYAKKVRGEDLITALIPLGARDETTDQRLTIESVNGGVDYVYNQEAVNEYGWIFGTQEWDDVTLASNLLRKATQSLGEKILLGTELSLSAVDLAGLSAEYSAFHLGTYVKVYSKPHDLDSNFLVSSLTIKLADPASNTLSLGRSYASFTQQFQGEKPNLGQIYTEVINGTQNQIQIEVENQVSSAITQTEQSIMTEVSENYYLKDDAEALVATINTQFEQTANSFNFEFEQFAQDLEALANGTDAKFLDISKYIRFINGDIWLGEEGSAIQLRIQNDRISFLENGVEVAYFSDRVLHVTQAEVVERMTIGNLAWYPRSNGNMTLRSLDNM